MARVFTAVWECEHTLREAQFEVPTWEALWAGMRRGQSEDDENPVEPKHGWQKLAARATHEDIGLADVDEPGASTLAVAEGTTRMQRIYGFPEVSVDADRSPTVVGSVVSSPPPPIAYLPMWPSPRLPWPPGGSHWNGRQRRFAEKEGDEKP